MFVWGLSFKINRPNLSCLICCRSANHSARYQQGLLFLYLLLILLHVIEVCVDNMTVIEFWGQLDCPRMYSALSLLLILPLRKILDQSMTISGILLVVVVVGCSTLFPPFLLFLDNFKSCALLPTAIGSFLLCYLTEYCSAYLKCFYAIQSSNQQQQYIQQDRSDHPLNKHSSARSWQHSSDLRCYMPWSLHTPHVICSKYVSAGW